MNEFAAKEKWAFAHSFLRASAHSRQARTNSSAISGYSSSCLISNIPEPGSTKPTVSGKLPPGVCNGRQTHLPSSQDGASNQQCRSGALPDLRDRAVYCAFRRYPRHDAQIAPDRLSHDAHPRSRSVPADGYCGTATQRSFQRRAQDCSGPIPFTSDPVKQRPAVLAPDISSSISFHAG